MGCYPRRPFGTKLVPFLLDGRMCLRRIRGQIQHDSLSISANKLATRSVSNSPLVSKPLRQRHHRVHEIKFSALVSRLARQRKQSKDDKNDISSVDSHGSGLTFAHQPPAAAFGGSSDACSVRRLTSKRVAAL